MEQQRAPGSGPGLGQLLGREHAEREPRVHQVVGQAVDGADAPFDHVPEADRLDVGKPLLDAAERAALEQVRRVDGVLGVPKLVGEGGNARGQALRVVKENYLSHLSTPDFSTRSWTP